MSGVHAKDEPARSPTHHLIAHIDKQELQPLHLGGLVLDGGDQVYRESVLCGHDSEQVLNIYLQCHVLLGDGAEGSLL